MNKIFKVIWSKSKQCYVVVSEMAKNKTGKKKIVVASILAALAMQAGVVADVSAADRPTATIEGGTKMYSNLTNGLAIGNESQSNSDQSIAIGYRAVANSQYANPAQPAVAVGAGASATGRGGVSLGLIANSGVRGTAIGSATKATGFGAFAGGTYAQATNGGDVAIGGATSDRFDDYAVASGGYSVAIGTAAKADGGAGVSIGYKTNAKTSNSLAVGSESQATGEGAVAVGRKNTSTGASSTVLGILSTANATSATAVGMETTAKGENSLAVGHKSSASGKNGVAVGTNFTTSDQGGVAVGNAAKSKETNATAVGIDVSANAANSVALGGSATANSDGAIAIGSHGSRQTTATGNRALAIGTAATANGLDNIAIGTSASTSSQYSTAVGNGATATAIRAAAFGANSTASVEGGVALGVGSVANRAGGIANKGYNPNDNRTNKYAGLNTWVLSPTTGAVAVGNGTAATRQITGLAAGKEDTDAVNVAQLKSVNLAFAGNVGSGDVNLANSTLGLKGDGTYITTAANGQNLTISGKTQNINVTNGQASANAAGMADAKNVTGDDGLATAKNVADAINKAVSANAYNWKLAADNDNGRSEVINKEDTVSFRGDNNITVARNGKKITTSLNKAITVDTVKANKSVTVSSGGNQITLDGSNGAVTGKTFTGQSFTAGNNVLSNTTLQIGPTTGNNVTITKDGLSGKAGSNTVKFGTNGISAGGQQIANVSSGGNVGTNAANITDVKNAVSDVTLKLDTNSKTGSVKLSESPLKVIGANGIRTDLVGTNNGSLVVGLDNNTVNATTKGIGLTGDTGSTGLKYLKDGDATFKVAGDGDLVTTKASATGVQVAVDSGKVKDLAVGAVTVSKANTADNPITITPTAGTNTKDYAIGIDTTKLANQTQLTYKANGANENKVSLANGLNFTNGTFTTATVGTNGNVTISTATETITNDADGKAKVASPTDGLATAKNVAESINKAVDGLSQNLTVSDGTTDGTVNLKNQKLTVSGTNGVTATVNGQTVTVGLDAATKSKVDNASTAVNRNISLGADSGTPSSQSLKDGDVAFNVKGTTGDFVSTKMNGNTVEVSTKRAAIDSNATTGAASVTGDDGLATAKNVADAINKAAKASSDAVNLKFSGDTNTSAGVVNLKDDTFGIKGDGKYVTTDADGKNLTVKVSEEEVKKSAVGAVTVSTDTTDANNPLTVTGTTSADGTTKDYKVTIDGTKVAAKTNLSYKANDGTAKQVSLADGLNFKNGNMTTASIDDAGVVKYDVNTETITTGADGTITGPATDGVATAKNVADAINAAKKSSKTEITANDGEAADGTTGNVVLTSSKAADGHTIYDVKLNDKVTLGTGANAVTLDGTTGAITGKTANIGGVTVDGTNKYVTGLGNTTWDGNAVSGRAATEDQLKAVADAAASQTWQITADKDAATSGIQTGTKKDAKVGKDAKVKMIAGENITINQNELDFTYSLNKDLVNMNSASFNGTGGNTTIINGDSITQTAGTQTNTSTAAGNTVVDGAKSTATTAAGTTITDGTKTNTSTADSTVIDDGNGNNTALTKDGVTITTAGKDNVSLTGNGLDNGNNKIVNVADGTNDTDAVNVRQLEAKTKASTTELTANGGESAGSTTGNIVLTKKTAADGHIIYDNKLNDKVTLGTDPTKAVTVDGTNGTIKAGKDGNAVAINGTDGTIKAGDGTNAVAIDGKNGSVKAGDKIALDGKDGKATIGTVGIDGKDGVISGLANKTWDPNNITPGRAATEDQVKSAVADAGWDAAVGTEGSGVNSTPSATAEKVKPNETLTFKAGNNMMVSQNGKSISYAVNPELTDMKSATFKDADGNTTVTNGNGMTITPGSANPNKPNAGPVSLTKDGLNNGNNQLKGIAPGTDDTDAVNVGQLKASNAKIGDAIGQVAGEVQRVGAHAAAMAALKPIQYDPLEPTQVMAGVGNYRGETAAALGLAHYTNEDTMFNVGVSLGANRNMVNAGVTHKFGSSPEKKNIPDRYKAGPISSVYVMQDEVSSLKKENSEQKTVIADQAARLNTLEAENERQRQELAETKQGLEDLRAAVNQLLSSKG